MLYHRALRYAQANEGPDAFLTALAHNNIAFALARLGRYDEALPEQRLALSKYARIYGTEHQLTAARMTNLGVIHYYLGHVDSAVYWFDRAETVYTAVAATTDNKHELGLVHSELLNNQAAIDANQGRLEQANTRLLKALQIVPDDAEKQQMIILRSLGDVCALRQQPEEAKQYWQQALDKATHLYGEDHPITSALKAKLQ